MLRQELIAHANRVMLVRARSRVEIDEKNMLEDLTRFSNDRGESSSRSDIFLDWRWGCPDVLFRTAVAFLCTAIEASHAPADEREHPLEASGTEIADVRSQRHGGRRAGGRGRRTEEEIEKTVAEKAAVFWTCDLKGLRKKANKHEDMEELAGLLGHCTSLTELELEPLLGTARTRGRPLWMKTLADSLGRCEGLRRVVLAGGELCEAAAGRLAHALSACPALTHLDLSRNQLGDEGAASLASAIPHWPALTHLDLRQNQICDLGFGELARALGSAPPLQYLDWSENEMTENEAVAAMLGRLSNLHTLLWTGMAGASIGSLCAPR